MTPAISVVVPTYERDFASWGTNVRGRRFADFQLIVVDDGSTDGAGEAVSALGPRIRHAWREMLTPLSLLLVG